MQRVFIPKQQVLENQIEIIGEDANHIKNVLRYKVGDKLEIVVQENLYIGSIETIEKDSILCSIEEELPNQEVKKVHLHILQALPKSDKMELIIQKTVELGVSEITPIIMERCVVKLDKNTQENKIQRWQKIAKAASEQSKRSYIPEINSIYNLKKIFDLLKDYDIVLVAYEQEKKNLLKKELTKLRKTKQTELKIACIVGPEGGITSQEVEFLTQNGAKCITLGKRILRTETAPIALSSIIMYELEE